VAGCAEAIPCSDGTFDTAVLSMVIHHFTNRSDASRELFRVRRSGGRVLIRNSFIDPSKPALIPEAEIQEGLQNMKQAAEAETVPQPVMDEIELLVFHKGTTVYYRPKRWGGKVYSVHA